MVMTYETCLNCASDGLKKKMCRRCGKYVIFYSYKREDGKRTGHQYRKQRRILQQPKPIAAVYKTNFSLKEFVLC